MNKLVRYIQIYLVLGLPFVMGLMGWETLYSSDEILKNASSFTKILFEGLAFNLMSWFVALIIFLVLLVVMPSAREKTLRGMANLKERDEREEYITGKAARATYIATLSLTILLLFFSMFSVEIVRVPESPTVKEKQLHVGISVGFSLLGKAQPQKNPLGDALFESQKFTLSSSAMLLILLGWQLLIFNIAARKEQN